MPGLRSAAAWLIAVWLVVASCGCATAPESCEMCGRAECTNMTLEVRRADGSIQRTCCARCGARLMLEDPRPVTSITVRDFDTAQPIDVERAVFVEGSDVHPCRGTLGDPPRDERGCCLEAVYDRCEPSVLAFATPEAARRFIERHGGTPTSWLALTKTKAAADS